MLSYGLAFLCHFLLFAEYSLAAPTRLTKARRPEGGKTLALRTRRTYGSRHQKRQLEEGLANDNNIEYNIAVTVGTPNPGTQGQEFLLQLDTGSSDTWLMSVAACEDAIANTPGGCPGGGFDPSLSATFVSLSEGDFEVEYFDNSKASGDWFADIMTLEDGSTLTAVQIGLAQTAVNMNEGLMGVGFRSNEFGDTKYPNIIDDLVDQDLITTPMYSLWLDDLQSSEGTILFGGTDDSKYFDDLYYTPILTNANGVYKEFMVNLDGVGVSGTSVSSDFQTPALLDSGTSLTYLPTTIYTEVLKALPFQPDKSGNIKCDVPTGTVDFVFGTKTISVPFDELAITQSDQTCLFGLVDGGSSGDTTLGDTFLRSAYVVYNLDLLDPEGPQIGIAQSKFS
ncbi:hypothetical protein H2200_010078 [Cladophialophora chaetospira]|uniref:Peptidase A1 domain-containing protein n=1 Tax=Cladophialophora chaetospira TaxID=386627 RepID=A0AA39CEL2_9EURO|nr:hypothetical protein H2200_010078 [Cladophialophora chaetospira]